MRGMTTESRPAHILSGLLIISALVTVVYWVDYFVGGHVRTLDAPWYATFEDAFPVADGWMAATCFLAGLGLWRGRHWGALMGLLAGSALLYLAALDITFDVNNSLYALVPSSAQMQFELLINVWTLALGSWTVLDSWQRASIRS